MKLYCSTYLYTIFILILFSCKSESNVTVYKIKKNNPLHTQKNNQKLSWNSPKNWIEKSPSDFSIASYDIPTSNGELINLSITTFPGEAGGITQNVNRWRKQINLESQNKEAILKSAKKESSMLGEYFIFDLHNNNKAIIAAIIPLSNNTDLVSETIFIKMNGSAYLLAELKYEFELFCKSIHWIQ